MQCINGLYLNRIMYRFMRPCYAVLRTHTCDVITNTRCHQFHWVSLGRKSKRKAGVLGDTVFRYCSTTVVVIIKLQMSMIVTVVQTEFCVPLTNCPYKFVARHRCFVLQDRTTRRRVSDLWPCWQRVCSRLGVRGVKVESYAGEEEARFLTEVSRECLFT